MRRVLTILTATLLATLMSAGQSLAQRDVDWGRSGVEISGQAGLFWPQEPDFTAAEDAFAFESDFELLFAGRVGYTFPINLFLQGEASYASLGIEQDGATRSTDAWLLGGSVGYNFQVARGAQLFALAGGGIALWEPDGLNGETQPRVHVGGGVRLFLTPSVAVRAEVRDNVIPATLTEVRRQLNPGTTIDDELTHNLELAGGISLFFGGPGDSDDDGVIDGRDACPGTPARVAVDTRGCPLDRDGDAVADHVDSCPNTVAGMPVDERGCALDADGDGVADGVDRCPNTLSGATVTEDGCALDTDGDGVANGLDRCPNSLAGATVNEVGCALDGDGDGVSDGIDRCPNTPADREVDTEGCSRVEAGLEAGRLILRNLYFDFNAATLRSQSRIVLEEVAQALIERPSLVVEVQGHTDSVGPQAYNQSLSQARAQAVADYLVSFPELGRDRFIVRGYGESQPIAPNDTPEGRQENRRVELIVVRR